MARVACVQSDVRLGDPKANAAVAVERLWELRAQDVDLVVFPEAFLTGYAVSSESEAREIAIPGTWISQTGDRAFGDGLAELARASEELDVIVVVGYAERDSGGDLYNSAMLLEPGREPRNYRKTHLPELGLDKFVSPGDELSVFDTRIGRVGILICFDLRIPEAARTLALKGAELIALPTNWPQGGPPIAAEQIAPTRAVENRVFVAACNRTGEEGGFRFVGRSGIFDVGGQPLARAGDEEEVLIAEIDLAQARTKRNVIVPGRFETDVIGTRKPRLYEPITRES